MARLKDTILFAAVTAAVTVFLYFFTFTSFGYGNWVFVIFNVVLSSLFFLLTPYRKKMTRLPNSLYVAFVVALFAEMYGFPLYNVFFHGCFWIRPCLFAGVPLDKCNGGRLVLQCFSLLDFSCVQVVMGVGMLFVIFGCRQIYETKGRLVTTGLYSYVRHPQYVGFLLITLGLNV